MKNYLCLLLVFTPLLVSAQQEFGKISREEFNLTSYEQDSTANAVVLFEKGNYYFQVVQRRVQLVKEYHVRIKILKEQGLDEANIGIPFYHNEGASENVKEIEAITHNGTQQMILPQDKIYTVDLNERWSEKRFTFSNVKEQSIIEYRYKLYSPFLFNLDGWTFQSNLPKVLSEFKAKIPGNYIYNRSLYGTLKLDLEEGSVQKNCFTIPGYSQTAACEVITYQMKNVPAIHEDEKHMLAPSNYISRIEFELAEVHRFDGSRHKFTKTWKDVDREFRTDRDIGRQLRKKDFFEKNVPSQIFEEQDSEQRAKNIYSFVKNHYTWNKKYGIYTDVRVKEAFQNKLGSVGEINISLINLLNAGGIPTDLMLLSTRENGLPKKVYPVITDFNYVIAKAKINGKDVFLDASSKLNPFGMLPFRCLNIYGRVMDFDRESYWVDIIPEKKNRQRILGSATLDPETGNIEGKYRETNQGYNAVNKHHQIDGSTREEYLDQMEENASLDIYLDEYTYDEEGSHEKLVREVFGFTVENVLNGDAVYFNPIFAKFFKQNPFLRKERHFPVDFGYPRQYEYNMSFNIPETYTVKSIPESKAVVLPNNSGVLRLACEVQGSHISVRYLLTLNRVHYDPSDYASLKKFFETAVNIEQNSLIELIAVKE